ncbi:hypothetical protein TruAng_011432 [Truncatella angustata]|nr:hypothetical protein TruAng_011432 [Truncatella angustata]
MSPGTERESSYIPAAYGNSCQACAHAKCKCFYQPGGTACERCSRLGKRCEPGTTSRKRKAEGSHHQLPTPKPLTTPSRLEDKLDDLVSLLRTQVEKQATHSQSSHPSTVESTPSSIGPVTVTDYQPEVVVDIENNYVQLLRPIGPSTTRSPVQEDVAIHHIPDLKSNEQLATFRRAFLPMFPFVHIPSSLNASELRRAKPFLWLNIMALTTISQQFAIEETIWKIISQRIVVQHFADLDLLLGLICFASWSHYFKKEKPFMTMLAQLAVSLSLELGLHTETKDQQPKRRSLEERRTMLAVFHLTSATWAAYRKTEPLKWSPYLDSCLRIISGDGAQNETRLDAVLAAQIKCHFITNELLSDSHDDTRLTTDAVRRSPMLTTALLRQLNDIQQSLPVEARSLNTVQLYIYNSELSIREYVLRKPINKMATADMQRLKDLDSCLTAVEGWLCAFTELPLVDAIGTHVDNFTQFLHSIVVLFKLSTLEEAGWDLEEVRSRADIFGILDSTSRQIEGIVDVNGMVDADGPRSGLFFKAKYLWRAIKALLQAEMPAHLSKSADADNGDAPATLVEEIPMDDFMMNLAYEPWLSDIFIDDWAPAMSFEMPLEGYDSR